MEMRSIRLECESNFCICALLSEDFLAKSIYWVFVRVSGSKSESVMLKLTVCICKHIYKIIRKTNEQWERKELELECNPLGDGQCKWIKMQNCIVSSQLDIMLL